MDMMRHSALATFKIFFFDFQQFDYDRSRCLSKFGFIELLGFSRLVFYIRLRKWLAIISSNNFSVLSSYPSPSGIPISHIFVYFSLYYMFLKCCSFYFQSFFLCSSGWIISVNLCSSSLTHFSVIWNLPLNSSC